MPSSAEEEFVIEEDKIITIHTEPHPTEVCAICEDFMDRNKETIILVSPDTDADGDLVALCGSCGTNVAKLHKHKYKRIRGYIDVSGVSIIPVQVEGTTDLINLKIQGTA